MTSVLTDYAETWEIAKNALRNRLPKGIFEQWFEEIRFASFANDVFTLVASDSFAPLWIGDNYADVLTEELGAALGRSVSYEIVTETPAAVPAAPAATPVPATVPAAPEPPARPAAPACELSPAIRRQNTFANFIEGAENQLALAISKSLANNLSDPDAANPLFIYGPSGVGKTHLMHAVANAVFDKTPSARICYVTCEMFTNDYTYALSQNAVHDFRRRYRDLNLLLMDDIQFLEGKKGLQEEFFHTFNQLVINGCKIVLTSDRPAGDIQIEDRLISRFQQGISTEIRPPCLEMRIAILLRKAQAQRFDFARHPGVLEFVAQNITRNVRNLEGAVNTLARYVEIRGNAPLSVPEVSSILGNLLRQEESAKLTPELIQRVVADAYRIDPAKMTAKDRSANVAFPRQIAMYLCRELINMTTVAVGAAFGKRDHGTVLHAIKTVKNRIDTSAEDKFKVEQIREKLSQRA